MNNDHDKIPTVIVFYYNFLLTTPFNSKSFDCMMLSESTVAFKYNQITKHSHFNHLKYNLTLIYTLEQELFILQLTSRFLLYLISQCLLVFDLYLFTLILFNGGKHCVSVDSIHQFASSTQRLQ